MIMKGYRDVLILCVALLVGVATSSAQSVEHMRLRLSERNEDDSFIHVEEDDATASAVRAVEAAAKPASVSGYRVVIFFDNSQYAGDNANKVLTTFQERYPTINAYLVYESPYFKVSVGDCLTMEEAVILMNRFIGDYPKAFPKREDIKLSDLANVRTSQPEPEPEAQDSVAMPDSRVLFVQ